MKVHRYKQCSFYFGTKETALDIAAIKQHDIPQKAIKDCFQQPLFFLHQVHSNTGVIIDGTTTIDTFKPFTHDGDFLITQQKEVCLAIATADCLPIVLYHEPSATIGIVHAGWRGTVDMVAVNAIQTMHHSFNIPFDEIDIFFGPSAHPCCYEIGPELIPLIQKTDPHLNSIIKIDSTLYLDVSLLNTIQLLNRGANHKRIYKQYTACTMCDHRYCSHRRDKMALRNVNYVMLS